MQLVRRLSIGLLGVLVTASVGAARLEAQVPAQVQAAEAAEGEASVVWEDLVLPRGFHLDLAGGRVVDRPSGAENLRYERGELIAEQGAVGVFAGSGRRVVRGELVHGSRWKAERELLLGFELGVRGWGFLRVLEVTPNHVRLERWAKAGGEPGSANWRPVRLAVSEPTGPGLAIAALEDPAGGPWRVESRRLGGVREWLVLGEWDGSADFVDPATDSESIREYRLVPLERGGLFGMRARGVAGRRVDDTTTPLAREDRVNLLTAGTSTDRFDLTVVGVSSGGVNIAPEPDVRIASLNSFELDGWLLPDDESTQYTSQQRYLGLDRELGVILPEGVFVHLRAVRGDDNGARLVSRVNLWGERLFMPAPRPIAWNWTAEDGVRFDAPPEPPKTVATKIAGRLLEREVEFDADVWVRVGLGTPGQPQFDPDPGPTGVVRYRCTWITRDGERGPAGEAFGVLVGDDGGPSSEALIDNLIAALGHADYDARRRARAGLRALGERALPKVRAALQSSDAEVAVAARELFSEITTPAESGSAPKFEKGAEKRDPDAKQVGDDVIEPKVAGDPALLASLAAARGLTNAPDGWLAPRAGERALALLASIDRPDDTLEAWRALLAEVDPDPAVRLAASLYPELARAQAWTPSFSAADASAASAVSEEALLGLDADAPWESLVRLQLLHMLHLAGTDSAVYAKAHDNAVLALQLLQRYAEGGETVFLDAALQMVSDPRARLRAARNLFELRQVERSRIDDRTEIVLESADGTLLREMLESFSETGEARIDLILPEGVYASRDGDPSPARVYGDGLRIIGRGHVRLNFGLMVLGDDANVSFENLEIDPQGAACLRLQDANAVMIGCRLFSAGQGIQVNSGVLELIDCVIEDREARGGKGGNGIRLLGRSACRLVRTRVEAGGDALIGARLALIERSVLDGGPRNSISGMIDGELLAVDSLIRGGQFALHSIGQGLLEGCVLLGDTAVATQLGDGFRACPAHLLSVGPEGQRNEWQRLRSCPVGR